MPFPHKSNHSFFDPGYFWLPLNDTNWHYCPCFLIYPNVKMVDHKINIDDKKTKLIWSLQNGSRGFSMILTVQIKLIILHYPIASFYLKWKILSIYNVFRLYVHKVLQGGDKWPGPCTSSCLQATRQKFSQLVEEKLHLLLKIDFL